MATHTGIGVNTVKGGSGSSYWESRYPDKLYVASLSDTTMRLDWTNNGASDYTGHKAYISTDKINYTLNKTVASILTTMTLTGLTANTHYWIKITAYKGSSESAFSNVNDDVTFPTILLDGNTVSDIYGNAISSITKDTSNRTSLISSMSGGANFAQAVEASRPLWDMTESLRFDGTDDYIQSVVFAFEQPCYFYMVMKQQTWTDVDRFLDGGLGQSALAFGQGAVFQSSQPKVTLNAGKGACDNSNFPMYRNVIVRAFFDGAASSLQINTTAISSGDAGTNDPNGITIGAARTGAAIWANMGLKAMIARKTADTVGVVTEIYNYLLEKYFTGRNVNMVWEGHSMMNLLEVAGDICVTDFTENKLMLNYGLKLRHSCNVAIGGATIANIVTRYAASVTANKNSTEGVKNYLTVFIGCNDIAAGTTGENAYNAMKAYIDQAITDGWIPIVVTMTKYGVDAGVETQRNIFNNLIRANGDWDYIVDLDLVPELTDNTNTTYFNADKVHLVTAGSERFANSLYKKIKEAVDDNTP